MSGPLEGIRVVEACQMVAGPMAAMICADLGADVVKIEQPKGGDRYRLLGHRVGAISAAWAGANRGKRSLVVDMQHPDGLAVARDLVAGADVFIQNFRPGVAERLGVGDTDLRSLNPRLVYVSVSGFGDTGPYIDQKSYDYVVQMLSGMAALQGGDGPPQLIRNIVIDKVTAMTAAQSILAALVARGRTGEGQHIRLSMIDTAIAFLWPDGMMQHSLLDADRVTPGAHMADGYVVRPTADSHLALMATSNSQWPGLCAALGTAHWMDDPRFATLADRERHAAELSELISAEVAKHPGRELVDRLHAHDVPCALANPLDRVHLDPQVVHNGTIVEHERPWLGRIREPRPPAHYSATPTSLGRHAPKFDEHTDEILAELGRNPEQVAALRTAGVVGPRR
ncbi:MAG: CoA transferase [Acidobacteria bacterium]|nr:CoA transferase [Acidobacteriota bacterium]